MFEDFDILEQYDDFGCIYSAVTLQVQQWDSKENCDNFEYPSVTTWYENVVLGWSYGTPDSVTQHVYTVGDIPSDIESRGFYGFDDLEDAERLEIGERARVCLNNPRNEDLEQLAGLRYLGTFDHVRNDTVGTLRNLRDFLDSIEYDDTISF